jgi:putative SOS response-associated peptidase YedK
MCGRFSLTAEPHHIEMRFGAKFITTDFEPTYNAAPSQMLPVILGRSPLKNSEHEIVMARWGFQPAWAKNWTPQINARLETAGEKPMFRHAFTSAHCLVLADGYYEWKTVNGKRQPFRFVMRNREPFAMAGIWEKPYFDETPATFAILTTTANELAAEVHDRMPVILPISYEHRWLTQTGHGMFGNLPQGFPADEMRCFPVTPKNEQGIVQRARGDRAARAGGALNNPVLQYSVQAIWRLPHHFSTSTLSSSDYRSGASPTTKLRQSPTRWRQSTFPTSSPKPISRTLSAVSNCGSTNSCSPPCLHRPRSSSLSSSF